jgi:biopolymer transport protein TolR
MAFSMPPIGGGRRDYRPLSEINVTPLVDVMLVLLVIFMITAPLLTVGVPVDLPKTAATQLTDKDEPLVVTVDAAGDVYLQETQIELENLVPRLVAVTDNKADTRIYVRGDQAINYGRVMEVMGAVNAAGFTRVGLVAEFKETPRATQRKAKGR